MVVNGMISLKYTLISRRVKGGEEFSVFSSQKLPENSQKTPRASQLLFLSRKKKLKTENWELKTSYSIASIASATAFR